MSRIKRGIIAGVVAGVAVLGVVGVPATPAFANQSPAAELARGWLLGPESLRSPRLWTSVRDAEPLHGTRAAEGVRGQLALAEPAEDLPELRTRAVPRLGRRRSRSRWRCRADNGSGRDEIAPSGGKAAPHRGMAGPHLQRVRRREGDAGLQLGHRLRVLAQQLVGACAMLSRCRAESNALAVDQSLLARAVAASPVHPRRRAVAGSAGCSRRRLASGRGCGCRPTPRIAPAPGGLGQRLPEPAHGAATPCSRCTVPRTLPPPAGRTGRASAEARLQVRSAWPRSPRYI